VANLRAGIVGVGVMGANHVRVLSNLEGVELVGIADPNPIKASLSGNIYKAENVEELISQNLDYCVISSPTVSHEDIAMKIIAKGIHVLIEKPLSHTYESAIRISKAAKSRGIIAAVGHIERFNSALQQARKRVLSGELGDIYQIATRRQSPFPARISDVGVVKDLATHDIDLTSWLTERNYLQVSANAAFKSGKDFEDLITVNALLQNNIVVNHIVNWLSPMKERKIIITGEKGTFVADTLHADLTYFENGKIDISQSEIAFFRGMTQGDVHILAFDKPEPLYMEHVNFRNRILDKPSEIVTLEEGCKTVKVAEAIIKSYQNLETIKL
jgi:predicted dehydrogenase